MACAMGIKWSREPQRCREAVRSAMRQLVTECEWLYAREALQVFAVDDIGAGSNKHDSADKHHYGPSRVDDALHDAVDPRQQE